MICVPEISGLVGGFSLMILPDVWAPVPSGWHYDTPSHAIIQGVYTPWFMLESHMMFKGEHMWTPDDCESHIKSPSVMAIY